MKILFAVNDGTISESIIKKYQSMYKEIIISKNVYYFNAIIKELQKDKNYDRIVISEELEPFTSNNYETIDNFLFEKLDNISDEATTYSGEDIPIILIAADRRNRTDKLLVRLFGIGVYSALLGQDRSIEELCKLIQKPRSKKEAKKYYRIDTNDVEYKPENEGDVSENEIQNILSYFKRLGKNEDRYVESFNSITTQYTDQQLKVIIKFLPANVKSVLEESSPKYQEIIAASDQNLINEDELKGKKRKKSKSKNENEGITVSSISSGNKLTKPVIIPSANKIKKVQEDIIPERQIVKPQPKVEEKIIEQGVDEKIKEDEVKIEESKRRRGRPRKIKPETQEETTEEKPKRRRGRPRKEESKIQNDSELDQLLEFDNFEEENTILPGFEQEDDSSQDFDDAKESNFLDFDDLEDFEEDRNNDGENNKKDENKYEDQLTSLPGLDSDDDEEENVEQQSLDDFEEDDYDTTLPGFDDEEEYDEEDYTNDAEENSTILPEYEEELQQSENTKTQSDISDLSQFEEKTDLQNYENKPATIEKLLTNNQKVVAFVGTTKNGTSFLVNNLAEVLSNQGIKTAILDLTQNKNSYYIYTKNEEDLRKTAFNCMEGLVQGIAQGIKVNSNLDVYTSLPNDDQSKEYQAILETLVQNYSLILIDCDFKTNYAYLNEAQEIYLVQSMDVLTIQPLTAYLRDLKAKGVLNQAKLKVIINKYTKVRGITEKAIVGGMAFYNDPAMAYMTELFNRETIPYCTIPFDSQVYAKYLEALINCNISIEGYSKDFINSLKKLANMVYPLVATGKTNKNEKYSNPKYNKYASNTFSNDVNSTLDKMRKNY